MWFKNLNLFRLGESFTITPEALEDALASSPLRACQSTELMTSGWSSPYGRKAEQMVYAHDGFMIFTLGVEEKLLPAGVIKDALEAKADELAAERGHSVGRKERQELKDEIVFSLAPRAFPRRRYTYAAIDLHTGWMIVDASSSKKAEEVTTALRENLGSLPVTPADAMQAMQAMRSMLGEWVVNAPANDFTVDDEIDLLETKGNGAVVRCRKQDVQAEEVLNHLEKGKEVQKLAVSWDDRISMVLSDDMIVRRLKFLDVIQDKMDDAEIDSDYAEYDARFALMAPELRRLLTRLTDLLELDKES